MWEVFDPHTGDTIYTTTYEWYARLLAWAYSLDYDREGEGYITPYEEDNQ